MVADGKVTGEYGEFVTYDIFDVSQSYELLCFGYKLSMKSFVRLLCISINADFKTFLEGYQQVEAENSSEMIESIKNVKLYHRRRTKCRLNHLLKELVYYWLHLHPILRNLVQQWTASDLYSTMP